MEKTTTSARGTSHLRDQQEALRWVQRNAAAFGRSTRRWVTIFGESAGGAAVVWPQLRVSASKGLFQRAIAESPVIVHPVTRVGAEQQTTRKCSRTSVALKPPMLAACLRALPSQLS